MSKRKSEPEPQAHRVVLCVNLVMTEMDGTPDQSANIAANILLDLLGEHTAMEEVYVGVMSCAETG